MCVPTGLTATCGVKEYEKVRFYTSIFPWGGRPIETKSINGGEERGTQHRPLVTAEDTEVKGSPEPEPRIDGTILEHLGEEPYARC